MGRFLTRTEFIGKLNRTVKLFFFRKDFNLENKGNLQIVQNFIQIYMTKYDFTCEQVKIQPREKGLTLRLTRLRRKSRGLFQLI